MADNPLGTVTCTSQAVVAAKPAKGKKKRLSPEGRKRIAEAVKRRWGGPEGRPSKVTQSLSS